MTIPPTGELGSNPTEPLPPTVDADAQTPFATDVGARGPSEGPSTPASEREQGDRTEAGADTDAPLVPGYEVLGELGRGGMGIVYRARHVRLKRLVALKMIRGAGPHGPQHQERLRVEAEAVARLQHPNVVQIFEVGEVEGQPFLALEYVGGGSLASKLAGTPLPAREAAQLAETIARAVHAAHAHGVIHRDLKPANVLLTNDGVPKITDFGVAKQLDADSSQTQMGQILGTPSYMAPEQARGGGLAVAAPADVYALGAILYEMLTGRPPFRAASVLDTLEQVRTQEPVPPTRLQPKCPRDLETICLKCLQKEASKRYDSCQALATDLHRFRSGEPIRARPIGRVERLWRWCRRNPRVALLSGAVAVLLGIVAVSAIAIGLRLSREREAIAETRKVAHERLEQATAAIAGGDSRRAHDLLQQANLPLLNSSPELADTRSQMQRLQEQVDVYAEFKKLLDQVRFTCFGSRSQKKEGQRCCRQLVDLYDQIESQTGAAASGLPPLNAQQQQRFKEDVFDAFLIAAIVERDLAAGGAEAVQLHAARRALDSLNRANKVLPGTRTIYAHRAACWGKLGNRSNDEADLKRARAIEPTTAVDLFWHGFATHLRGDKALRRGERKEAEQQYRQELAVYAAFLRLRPDHFWGYFNWSLAHVQLGDSQEAIFGFTACIHLRPDFPWSYNNRGAVLLRLKRFDLAIEDCTAALARDDRYFEAYENRGLASLHQGKTASALRDFNRAIELNPNHAPLYLGRAETLRTCKRQAEALRDYDRMLELGADKAQVYVQRAETYREMNRLAEALRECDRVIALNAKNPEALYRRAGLHLAVRHYLQARDDYSAILALVPRAVNVYRDRAILNWIYLKDFDAALADCEQLLRLQPQNPEPYRIIGSIHLGRRQYESALRAFRKALDLKRGYTEVVWAVAQIHHWQGDSKKALEVLDPLIAHLSPEAPESLNVRGDIYRSLGRLDDAVRDYRRLIELRPKAPDAYLGLALVLDNQGAAEQARACYDRMVAANPESALVYLRRAEFRRNRGEFEAALADCAQAAGKEPDAALPALVRASVVAARGQHQRAVADAGRALKKAPKDDGHVLYAAACVWSLASRTTAEPGARRAADRATDLLAEALDKGFHDLNFPEHNRMADDPALAPIRTLPRVRDLLAHKP